jgi:hypothetical protein
MPPGGGGIFLPVLGVEIMIKEDKKGEIDEMGEASARWEKGSKMSVGSKFLRKGGIGFRSRLSGFPYLDPDPFTFSIPLCYKTDITKSYFFT